MSPFFWTYVCEKCGEFNSPDAGYPRDYVPYSRGSSGCFIALACNDCGHAFIYEEPAADHYIPARDPDWPPGMLHYREDVLRFVPFRCSEDQCLSRVHILSLVQRGISDEDLYQQALTWTVHFTCHHGHTITAPVRPVTGN